MATQSYNPNPEQCAFPVLVHANGGMSYPCPAELWASHFDAWKRERLNGNKTAIEPMQAGHCMFERPSDYSRWRYGEANVHVIRRAIRNSVIAKLNGWDRDLRKTASGMRSLAKIVRATVDAKMSGHDVGAAPFMACIHASIF